MVCEVWDWFLVEVKVMYEVDEVLMEFCLFFDDVIL